MKTSWSDLLSDPMRVSNVVIAGAAIANLIVSTLLWVSTKQSADLAQKSFEAGNRPYVGTSRLTMGIDRQKHILEFSVVMKNFGNVPAEGDMGLKQFLNGQEQGARL